MTIEVAVMISGRVLRRRISAFLHSSASSASSADKNIRAICGHNRATRGISPCGRWHNTKSDKKLSFGLLAEHNLTKP
jgi:hypothetical protein